MPTTIAIVNHSTVCTDDEIAGYLPALQKQVSADFEPAWGAGATLTFVPSGAQPDPESWLIVILDNSDQAGILGIHDLTAQGLPLGKVFAASDHQSGHSVSLTLSHELLEMLGDPGINRSIQAPDPSQGNNPAAVAFYAFEACDACEADEYGYKIDGVLVSDFVYPEWFGGVAATRYDQQGLITAPFQILPRGYISVWTPSMGWSQVTGQNAEAPRYSSRAAVGSRRERRRVGPNSWIRSTQ